MFCNIPAQEQSCIGKTSGGFSLRKRLAQILSCEPPTLHNTLCMLPVTMDVHRVLHRDYVVVLLKGPCPCCVYQAVGHVRIKPMPPSDQVASRCELLPTLSICTPTLLLTSMCVYTYIHISSLFFHFPFEHGKLRAAAILNVSAVTYHADAGCIGYREIPQVGLQGQKHAQIWILESSTAHKSKA